MIVDSPGIGESDIMDNQVMQYLPEATAFIYVINSSNAGGVQKDRVWNKTFSVLVSQAIFQTQFNETFACFSFFLLLARVLL